MDPTTMAPAMPAAMIRKIRIGRYSRSSEFIDRGPWRWRTPSARPPAPQKRRHYRALKFSKKGQNNRFFAAQNRSADRLFPAAKMAGATGLEPAASGVTGRRSNQLSYAPARRPLQGGVH